jgi:hypothetical protein
MSPTPEATLRSPLLLRLLMTGRFNTRTLAAKAGTTHQFVAHLGAGRKSSCRRVTAIRIADALGVSVGDLFFLSISDDASPLAKEDR